MHFSFSTYGDYAVDRDKPRSFFSKFKPKSRSRLFTSFAAISLALFFFLSWSTHSPRWKAVSEEIPADLSFSLPLHVPLPAPTQVALDPLDPLASLNGPPTDSLWDNLRSDTKYISSWISAGWTNDVMTYGNLLYLALITDRIPILGQFTPSHIGSAPTLHFGDVFDVPYLRESLGRPVLEWHEVKRIDSEVEDEIGCWNIWEAVQYNEHAPRRSPLPDILGLDISYTLAPAWVKMIPNFEHDQHSTFWSLATLAFPQTRNANLQTPLPSPLHNVSLPPNEHLVCYDYLYYVTAHQSFEWEWDYSPAWRYVGQYMRWTESLQDVADHYIRVAIGIPEYEPIPYYIGIHVRHNDFANWCWGYTLKECFANTTVIARRVQEVRDELQERRGLDIRHVIMTSDDNDPDWWADVAAQGWLRIDHSRTEELYGRWYPVLIDAVIQSSGVGFVGTDRSTMSIMAARRVQTWYDGATRQVKWGSPDADDH